LKGREDPAALAEVWAMRFWLWKWRSKVAAILLGCFLLAALNGLWLLWLQNHNTEFRASPAYSDYLSRRYLFSKPFPVVSIFGLIVFGIAFIAKPHIEPSGEFDEKFRLIILAILTCGGLGYLISLLISP
jgi:hypothetical protein